MNKFRGKKSKNQKKKENIQGHVIINTLKQDNSNEFRRNNQISSEIQMAINHQPSQE